jgi:hypothetical protein
MPTHVTSAVDYMHFRAILVMMIVIMVGLLLGFVILVIANLNHPKLQDFAYVSLFRRVLSYRCTGAMPVMRHGGWLMVVEACIWYDRTQSSLLTVVVNLLY